MIGIFNFFHRLKKIGDSEESTYRRLFSADDVSSFLNFFLGVNGTLRRSILSEEEDGQTIIQANANFEETNVKNIVGWQFDDL